MSDKRKDEKVTEKVTKLVNLMVSTESENEALQCWRSARTILPTGKLLDTTHGRAAQKPNFELAAAQEELKILRASEGKLRASEAQLRSREADQRKHVAKLVDREAYLVVRLKEARKEELKFRLLFSLKRELANKERRELPLPVAGEDVEMDTMPRAAREHATLIAGIERLSASNPEWTDRQIARELKISPSTVGKYRNASPPRTPGIREGCMKIPKECPRCKADLTGEPIPEASHHLFAADATNFLRTIGISDLGKDQIVHWQCSWNSN